jgi:hypothetical protein
MSDEIEVRLIRRTAAGRCDYPKCARYTGRIYKVGGFETQACCLSHAIRANCQDKATITELEARIANEIRNKLDERCKGCEHKQAAVGACLPGLESDLCLKSPIKESAGTFQSIYAVGLCPVTGAGVERLVRK